MKAPSETLISEKARAYQLSARLLSILSQQPIPWKEHEVEFKRVIQLPPEIIPFKWFQSVPINPTRTIALCPQNNQTGFDLRESSTVCDGLSSSSSSSPMGCPKRETACGCGLQAWVCRAGFESFCCDADWDMLTIWYVCRFSFTLEVTGFANSM